MTEKPTFLRTYPIRVALSFLLFIFVHDFLSGQTVIGGGNPDSSAMLDIQSDNRGVLFPRMSAAQRDAIAGPATGLLIYNTDSGSLEINLGSPVSPRWVRFMLSGDIGSLDCAGATVSGNLASGVAATGVSVSLPYADGNGGSYQGQSVASTGVTGLIATLPAGTFAMGSGLLTLTISGTPASGGTAYFSVGLGGQGCVLALDVPGTLGSLGCGAATLSGMLTAGVAAVGVAASVPYAGGNGGNHGGQAVASTGVSGLTATLAPGAFANGDGQLVYTISGTPAGGGTAHFDIMIGGESCALSLPVSGSIASLDCGGAGLTGTSLVAGRSAAGLNVIVPYTGGSGGGFAGLSFVSTGVTGLTASLPAGTFANGAGVLSFQLSGTPAAAGTAAFALEIGGQFCTLSLPVDAGAVGALACGNASWAGSLIDGQAAVGVSLTVPYSGGNGGSFPAVSAPASGVTGLTASLAAGLFAEGAGSLLFSVTGTPAGTGTASFELLLGGQSCTVTTIVTAGTIGSLNCWSAVLSGELVVGQPATGLTLTLPYSGGNGLPYAGQTVASTGAGGLTATLAPGTFANGNGQLVYTLSGTPIGGGAAVFDMTAGGQSCAISLSVSGSIGALNCGGASLTGTLVAGKPVAGLSVTVPYSGGNGGSYSGQSVSSTGIGGLTASLAAGIFANGAGTFSLQLTGTPAAAGTAGFALQLGGQSCTLSLPVANGSIGSLDCDSASWTGSLIAGLSAAGVSLTVPYVGGNGGSFAAASVSSTGVTGLTAALPAGLFAEGAGSLLFSVTGTPAGTGTASFALLLGGQSCTVTTTVTAGTIASLDCGGAALSGAVVVGQSTAGLMLTVPYTGGNGMSHAGQTVASTGLTGLTATLVPGTFANGSGQLVYALGGTPATGGAASFALHIGGKSCLFSLTVAGSINSLDCGGATLAGELTANQTAVAVTAIIPYSGGNGGAYAGQTLSSTGISGLTATLAAGNFLNGEGLLFLAITGTPTVAGTADFALEIGGQSCSLSLAVTAGTGCHAKVSATTSRNFLCHNLAAANTSADPFTPGWEIVGGYWQWGRKGPDPTQWLTTNTAHFAHGPTGAGAGEANEAAVSGWSTSAAVSGAWTDAVKTANDPCPAGYRIPTKSQWDNIRTHNTQSSVGTWTGGPTNYSSGRFFGTGLLLPAAGNRNDSNGSLASRGSVGYYWSSTEYYSISDGFLISFQETAAGSNNFSKINGFSVRCIVEDPGTVGSLSCGNATLDGALIAGLASQGVSASLPYTGGQGGQYAGQSVSSYGVSGLTATLAPGVFASGNGNALVDISGTPSDTGTAVFPLVVGGKTCALSLPVAPAATLSTLDCGVASLVGNLLSGQPAMGVSVVVPYTGGNGGAYGSQSISSSGVTGLTASTSGGYLAIGSGNLQLSISGTPADSGTAFFAVTIGGQTCSLALNVAAYPHCRAKVSATEYKTFLCLNLGAANTAADPFTPSWEIIGGYWQWGRKGPDPAQWPNTNTAHFTHGPTGPGLGEANEGSIANWSSEYAPDGSWADGSKTINDPCPSGYRVPTRSQWEAVLQYNAQSTVGAWFSSLTNYSSAGLFGPELMLPAAGSRGSNDGSLFSRGYGCGYWSSTENGPDDALILLFSSGYGSTTSRTRRNGFSVRCAAE